MISKTLTLPQFMDEEVALMVNGDSSPSRCKRVAHSVSVILLKDGLKLPRFVQVEWSLSGKLLGLQQIMLEGKEWQVMGGAQSR